MRGTAFLTRTPTRRARAGGPAPGSAPGSAPTNVPDATLATVDPPATTPTRAVSRAAVIAWARRLLLLAVVAYVAYQLAQQWHEVSTTLLALPWTRLTLSFAAVCVGVLLGPLVWRAMLADLGSRLRVRDAMRIYLVGQLGKYVPGSVVAVLMQMELARAVGVTRSRSFTASILTAGIVVVGSLLAGLLGLPAFLHHDPRVVALFGLLPIGLVMLHPRVLTWAVNRLLRLLRREPLPHRLTAGAIGTATSLSVATYVAYGVHMFVLVGALHSSSLKVFLLCVGGMGLAMTAGLVAFVLPSGIGARELVIVTALGTVLPYGQALALAVVSRLMFTVTELVTAGVAAVVPRLSAHREGARAVSNLPG